MLSSMSSSGESMSLRMVLGIPETGMMGEILTGRAGKGGIPGTGISKCKLTENRKGMAWAGNSVACGHLEGGVDEMDKIQRK